MDLGIAIVSYNTRQLTLACLRSLADALADDAAAGTPLQTRVCVVDNASSDASAAAISELVAARLPGSVLIPSAENLGFARGSNLALERLLADPEPPRHLLLLNPDTLVPPRALPLLVSFLDQYPGVGVVGPRLIYGDGSFQHAAFRFPTLWMAFFDFWTIHHRLINSSLNGRYSRALYDAGRPFPIDHPLGAALMIRRQAVEQVGLLDPSYFMYCEEIDWCMRVKQAGWNIYCVPGAVIVHLGGQSARQFREPMFVALWRSRYRLFDKYYPSLYRHLVRRLVRLGLAWDAHRLERSCRRGEITAGQVAARLAAYRQVNEL
jgi:N-acetylglucosaminyl-diphospho-decaprenol L-rhamnosyltransferase